VTVATPVQQVWSPEQWQPRRDAHQRRVDGWLAGHRERRGRGEKHPVADFLFDYYSYRPYQLRRWHPGAGVVLAGPAAEEPAAWPHYRRVSQGVTLDTDALLDARGPTVRWVHDLLVQTSRRPAGLGCFGLHEWAMVYRAQDDELRHAGWPLRFPAQRVAEIVEERGVRCTHFDAFRFFTPAARPLNSVQPTRADSPLLEQPGCLHANMDLYKHAYKLSPLVSSDLVAETFALARDIRTLDMRASPYDLTGLGLNPVMIETAAGRAEYVQAQREFSLRSAPLRQALIELTADLLPG
jgi:hypothetical protein